MDNDVACVTERTSFILSTALSIRHQCPDACCTGRVRDILGSEISEVSEEDLCLSLGIARVLNNQGLMLIRSALKTSKGEGSWKTLS